MAPVRLALIGLGVIGKRHLQALSEVEEAELVAITDTNPGVQELAQQLGVGFYSALLKSGLRGHPKEETAAIALEFESGVLGTILLSDSAPSPWTWEQATGENPNFPQSGQNVYRFLGSKAALEFPRLTLWSSETTADWNHPLTPKAFPTDWYDAYVAQCKHFCQVISGAESPRITAQDATRTLAATLAVFESGETGQAASPANIN